MTRVLAILVLALSASTAIAQDVAVERLTEAPATELAAPIQAILGEDAIKVTPVAGTTLTFWWVKSLPLEDGSGAPAWSQVAEGTIVGAVRIAGQQKDIRGRRVKQPGVYVLRYALQPATGDHLGVSPFRDFLLLMPAILDKTADVLPQEKLFELSARAISVSESHPAALSLDPPVASEEALNVHTNAPGHKAVVFEVPTGRESQKLRFGLVVVGEIKP